MNNPANQQIQVLKTVAKWADRFTCIRKIHVFGSFARCEAFSDVDIAVEYTTKDPSPECYTAVNTCSGELALLWQIYSCRCSLQIHFRQCGHRCGGRRAKTSRMVWRTAGKV